ncbi:ribonuclease 7-like [Octodon degus]|uniref:Ribonuclease K6 n=1 Tax=Octodon degus TaxID=10160 RepID=A0A6P3FPF5_OCTDE|nr:ribonuclease 7-like [Octodon degus]
MVPINQAMRKCKESNTFLHVSLKDVYKVCDSKPISCKNGAQLCHKSENLVGMTACKIKIKDENIEKCTYNEMKVNDYYTVACILPGGSTKLTPSHLD